MNPTLSATQVAKLAGVSLRQVGYWAKTGLVKPSAPTGSKRGRRRYAFRDLVALATVAKLRKLGCPLQAIRKAVAALRKRYRHESDVDVLARYTLLTDGHQVYMLDDNQAVLDVVSHQHVLSIALGEVIAEMRSRLESLPQTWTQPVIVYGSTYHLQVTRDVEDGGYIVQCRELPGALDQGQTVAQTIENGKQAIAALLTVEAKLRRSRGRDVAAG